eukprot:gene18231-biopygen9933
MLLVREHKQSTPGPMDAGGTPPARDDVGVVPRRAVQQARARGWRAQHRSRRGETTGADFCGMAGKSRFGTAQQNWSQICQAHFPWGKLRRGSQKETGAILAAEPVCCHVDVTFSQTTFVHARRFRPRRPRRGPAVVTVWAGRKFGLQGEGYFVPGKVVLRARTGRHWT